MQNGTTIERKELYTENGAHVVEKQHSRDYIMSPEESRLARLERMRRLGGFAIAAVTTLLAFRFVLLLLAANPANPFAAFILNVTDPLVGPFLTLFGGNPAIGNSVLEFPTLIAIAFYALAGYGLMALARITFAPSDPSGRAYE